MILTFEHLFARWFALVIGIGWDEQLAKARIVMLWTNPPRLHFKPSVDRHAAKLNFLKAFFFAQESNNLLDVVIVVVVVVTVTVAAVAPLKHFLIKDY